MAVINMIFTAIVDRKVNLICLGWPAFSTDHTDGVTVSGKFLACWCCDSSTSAGGDLRPRTWVLHQSLISLAGLPQTAAS